MNKRLILLTLFPLVLNCGCSKSNNNIDSYDKLLVMCRDEPDFHSELYVFPDSTNIGTPTSFAYKTTPDLLTGSFLLYLVMSYDQEAYDAELSRLDKIEAHFSDEAVKKIIHFEDKNLYLAISRNSRYEYAMYFEDELKIAYVSNQLYSWLDTSVSPKYRLPDLKIPAELDDGENSYNLYYHYIIDPDLDNLQVGIYVNDWI